MQGRILIFLFLSVTLVEGWFFNSNKCPIKKYKTGKSITGYDLYVHEDFNDRVKTVEKVAKDCKVHVYVTGSYSPSTDSYQQVSYSTADLAIGHAFKFELRGEDNSMLCNELCLSKNPTDLPEVNCFLKGATNQGLKWSRYYSNILSDGTYASDPQGYQKIKSDVQSKCQNSDFKRALVRALRQMYEEEQLAEQEEEDDDDKKKK